MNIKISEKEVSYRIQNKNTNEITEPIGAIIKNERVSQGLNQDFVCKDICSVSYYSRIENNKIVPTHDYVIKIFSKLKRPIPKDTSIKFVRNECIDRFLLAIDYRNNQMIEHEYKMLKEIPNINRELYDLIYMINHGELIPAYKLIQILHPIQNYLSNFELGLLMEYTGTYHALCDNYQYAEHFFKCAMNLNHYLGVNKPIVIYRYAWTIGKLNQDLKCIENAQKAYEIFTEQKNIYRAIQCQLLIAIKYSIHYPEKAISLYESIIQLTYHQQILDINKISNYNLAILLKKNNNFEKCKTIFNYLVENYDHEKLFIFDVYVEYIDLERKMNIENAKTLYQQFLNKNYTSPIAIFYYKYYESVFCDYDLQTRIKLYKNNFLPWCMKFGDPMLELRFRKEYLILLENNHSINDCLNEYKKIIDILGGK